MDWDKLYDVSTSISKGSSSITNDLTTLSNDSRYIDKKFVNQGSMKVIYKCQDLATNRIIAYAQPKSSDPDFIENFLREARITASLQHPNIIPIYDIGINSDGPYFSMKLIDGESLTEVIRNEKKELPEEDFIQLFLQVCEAISYAHSRGIIHLDLKPSNIQISARGEVLLIDWGLSKIINWEKTETSLFLNDDAFNKADILQNTLFGHIKGTPGYLSPEQAKGGAAEKTYRSDIYSLGAILYTIFYKEPPIQGDDIDEILTKTTKGLVFELESSPVSASLQAIIFKAMALTPEDRYDSVDALISDIKLYLNGFAPKAEKTSSIKKLDLYLRRNTFLITLVSTFIGVFFLIASYASLQLGMKNKTLNSQKNELILEKEKAERLVEQFQQAQKKIDAYVQLSARQYYTQASSAFQSNNYDEALKKCTLALEVDPSSREANELFAKLALAKLNLPHLKEIASKHPSLLITKCLNLLEDYYSTENLEINEQVRSEAFTRLFTNTQSLSLRDTSNYMLSHHLDTYSSEQDQMGVIMRLLLYFNKKALLEASWVKVQGSYTIWISNTKNISHLEVLNSIDVDHLIFKKCQNIDLKKINLPKLRKLSFRHSELNDWTHAKLSKLELPNLSFLSFDYSNITSLKNVSYLKIKTLSIQGLRLKDYSFLKTLPELEKIIIDELPKNFPKDFEYLVTIKKTP